MDGPQQEINLTTICEVVDYLLFIGAADYVVAAYKVSMVNFKLLEEIFAVRYRKLLYEYLLRWDLE